MLRFFVWLFCTFTTVWNFGIGFSAARFCRWTHLSAASLCWTAARIFCNFAWNGFYGFWTGFCPTVFCSARILHIIWCCAYRHFSFLSTKHNFLLLCRLSYALIMPIYDNKIHFYTKKIFDWICKFSICWIFLLTLQKLLTNKFFVIY